MLTGSEPVEFTSFGLKEIGCEIFVLTKEQVGSIVMTSDSHRALVVVANSLGVGTMYEVVLESLWAAKPYVTPILVSTYAIEAAFPVLSVRFPVIDAIAAISEALRRCSQHRDINNEK
jgi:hypothetical protein